MSYFVLVIFHEQALHVAGQVAGTSVSTSPLPYGAMASQCEALGMGARKKLSSWLVGSHDSISDTPSPIHHDNEQKAFDKVLWRTLVMQKRLKLMIT